MASRAPSRANKSAVASPMPEVPPVMRATCWFRRMRFEGQPGRTKGTRSSVLGESRRGRVLTWPEARSGHARLRGGRAASSRGARRSGEGRRLGPVTPETPHRKLTVDDWRAVLADCARSSPSATTRIMPSGPRRARQVGGNREAERGTEALECQHGALFPVIMPGEGIVSSMRGRFPQRQFCVMRSGLACHFLSVDPACSYFCGRIVADDLWKTKCTEAE